MEMFSFLSPDPETISRQGPILGVFGGVDLELECVLNYERMISVTFH